MTNHDRKSLLVRKGLPETTGKDLMKQFRDLVHAQVHRKISLFLPRPLQQRLSTRWMIANMDWART